MPVDADRLLRGKVALLYGVTGAVGTALATRLQQGGARIGAAVRRPWQVAKVTEQLGREGVLAGCVPPMDSEAAAGFVKGVEDALGPIAAFLCTAGAFHSGPFLRNPSASARDLVEANYLAPVTLGRAVVGPMRRRRTGRLVFVGADAVGEPGGQGMVTYLASKAALHEFVRALDAELAPDGLRAMAVLPGVLDTEANRTANPAADRSGWQAVDTVVDRMLECAFADPAPAGPLFRVYP